MWQSVPVLSFTWLSYCAAEVFDKGETQVYKGVICAKCFHIVFRKGWENVKEMREFERIRIGKGV